jgi:hypothetical protein
MEPEVLATKDHQSLGELFTELLQETTTLAKQEVSLAKAELEEKATRIGKDIAYLAVGGAIAYAGLLALLTAAVFGLCAAGLPAWAAALLVGGVALGGGGGLILIEVMAIRRIDPLPRQTLDTLKEGRQWIKGPLSRGELPKPT